MSILNTYNITYELIDLTTNKDKYAISCSLNIHTGYQSFPNVYFGQNHIGGYDDFITFESCKETFSTMLNNADIKHCEQHLKQNQNATIPGFFDVWSSA